MHEEDIIHGDLKGVMLLHTRHVALIQVTTQVNILVDSSGRAYVADFGLSAVNESKIACWTSNAVGSKGGTVRWQAPELNDPEIDDTVHNSKESDVYAWGCVCYEVHMITLYQYIPDNSHLGLHRTDAVSRNS